MDDRENTKFNPPPGLVRIDRTLTISGRPRSVRLEPSVWQALDEVCQRQQQTPDEVVTAIDRQRGQTGLVTAIRSSLTRYFKEAADRDRPYRGLSEAAVGDPPTLSPAMSRALDSIGPPPKRPK